ncbi:unnamed protein product [Leuciscus chuanchicus]
MPDDVKLTQPHESGPMLTEFPMHQYVQYKMFKHKDTVISNSTGTNCFKLEGRVVIVQNIVHSTGGTHVVYERFETGTCFFNYPIDSTSLGVRLLSKLSGQLSSAPSQLSTQQESSEHSDSSEELPPTPPNQLFLPAVKKVNNSTARGTSSSAHQLASPTARGTSSSAQQLASPTAGGTSSSAQQLASPTAGGTSSSAQQLASPTAGGTSSSAQQLASPTAGGTSSSAQQLASPTAGGTSSSAQQLASPTAGGTSSSAQQLASPTARGTSPTCETMFTKLLTVLEEVKETQRVHRKMLNALLKKQDGSVLEVPEGVVLPLKTQADLEALDQKLGDRSLMSAVAMVADVGGTSVDDATRRMMKYIFSNELAMEYNLFGRHGKKKFKDLRLFNVMYGAERTMHLDTASADNRLTPEQRYSLLQYIKRKVPFPVRVPVQCLRGFRLVWMFTCTGSPSPLFTSTLTILSLRHQPTRESVLSLCH